MTRPVVVSPGLLVYSKVPQFSSGGDILCTGKLSYHHWQPGSLAETGHSLMLVNIFIFYTLIVAVVWIFSVPL